MQTDLSPARLREEIRQGNWQTNTSGMAAGYVQCNIVILPEFAAGDFLQFCQANPKPCPLIAVSEPGDPHLPQLGDIDIRHDLPRYRLFREGVVSDEVTDIGTFWRDDFVTFALGCSFSFEEALLEAGLEIRNITEQVNVPMYNTSLPCEPAGDFTTKMVVSMRPFKAADAIRAIEIAAHYPSVHGAPVHLGDPALIGIADLDKPDYGDPVTVHADEIPLFWACGVTPQAALAAANLPLAITHSPGCMLVTDMLNSTLKQ